LAHTETVKHRMCQSFTYPTGELTVWLGQWFTPVSHPAWPVEGSTSRPLVSMLQHVSGPDMPKTRVTGHLCALSQVVWSVHWMWNYWNINWWNQTSTL